MAAPTAEAANQEDTSHCHDEAQEKPFSRLFFLFQQKGENCRKEWGDGNDYADIGGIGIGKGYIFQKEIQGYPAQPCHCEVQLLFSFPFSFSVGTSYPECKISDEETDKKNFYGAKALQQYLRGNKSGSPYENCQERRQMSL